MKPRTITKPIGCPVHWPPPRGPKGASCGDTEVHSREDVFSGELVLGWANLSIANSIRPA